MQYIEREGGRDVNSCGSFMIGHSSNQVADVVCPEVECPDPECPAVVCPAGPDAVSPGEIALGAEATAELWRDQGPPLLAYTSPHLELSL